MKVRDRNNIRSCRDWLDGREHGTMYSPLQRIDRWLLNHQRCSMPVSSFWLDGRCCHIVDGLLRLVSALLLPHIFLKQATSTNVSGLLAGLLPTVHWWLGSLELRLAVRADLFRMLVDALRLDFARGNVVCRIVAD